MAKLEYVEGIGEEYADLLEEAGVDTVVELKNRNPGNLHKRWKKLTKLKNWSDSYQPKLRSTIGSNRQKDYPG